MKVTDFAIIFQVVFICLITVTDLRGEAYYNRVFCETMVNNVFDGIVEDGLYEGFTGVDAHGEPYFSLDRIRNCVIEEMGFYSLRGKFYLIFVDENSFSICSGNKGGLWENIWFTSEKHEEKVSQIRECVSDKYNLKINLPLNDGETYLNTVDKYSLIGVYVQKNLDIHCLGGAQLKKKDIKN